MCCVNKFRLCTFYIQAIWKDLVVQHFPGFLWQVCSSWPLWRVWFLNSSRTHGLFGICILIGFAIINIGDINCFIDFTLPSLQYLYTTFAFEHQWNGGYNPVACSYWLEYRRHYQLYKTFNSALLVFLAASLKWEMFLLRWISVGAVVPCELALPVSWGTDCRKVVCISLQHSSLEQNSACLG